MGRSRHTKCLEDIVNNIGIVGLNKRNTSWIIPEGVWYIDNSIQLHKLCDLVVGMHDRTAIPIEIKATRNYNKKAIEQLYAGKQLAEDYMHYEVTEGKIVYYGRGIYQVRNIDLRG